MVNYAGFKRWLEEEGKLPRTVEAYTYNLSLYEKSYSDTDKILVQKYKAELIAKGYKPQTINLRIQAVNSYNLFLGCPDRVVTFVKCQRKCFVENVISIADYRYLCNCLKRDGDLEMYFLVKFLGCTGARISEAVTFKAESLPDRCIDIYGKGGKQRRIWIPTKLCQEAYAWKQKGLLFPKDPCMIRWKLRQYADRYHIDRKVMHPHSFRHMAALNIAAKNKDISFLCDILGHASYDTCRIYLQKSSSEMQKLVDRVVTW